LGSLDLIAVLWLAVSVLASGFVRGFSGFGASALLVSTACLVLSPRIVVPLSLVLEIVASLHMLAWVKSSISWRVLVVLSLGMLVTTPFGISILSGAPTSVLRAVIAVVILAASFALWHGLRLRRESTPVTAAVGLASGLANGIGAVGGLPVVAYFLSIEMSAATIRATTVAYLLIACIYAGAWAGVAGIYDRELLTLIAAAIPILALGIWLGHRAFNASSPERSRRVIVLVLGSLSVVTLLRVWWDV